MGRKSNNMPVRKKKIKDRNNHQIQGRAGRGRKRVTQCANRMKEKIAGGKSAAAQAGVGEAAPAPPPSWLEMARRQEELAAKQELSARRAPDDAEGDAPGRSKKARRRQRERAAAAEAGAAPDRERLDRSFRPRAGAAARGSAVDFSGSDDDGGGAPDASPAGSAATPSASSTAAPSATRGQSSTAAASPAAPAPGEKLDVGAEVVVLGLQRAPELNGRVGKIKRWDAAAGRWLVALAAGGEKLLRAENLRVREVAANGPVLYPGADVRIVGLLGAVALNGKLAKCRSFDELRSRWLVSLDGGDKLLRPDNLQVVFKPGSVVRLVGLASAPGLNGRPAVCLAWDEAKSRWRVRVEGGEEKSVRAENLELRGVQTELELHPAVRQALIVCAEDDKPAELLKLLKRRREEEKRGARPRELILVICRDAASSGRAADALKSGQFGHVALDARRDNRQALARLGVDRKQILLAADAATDGLRLTEPVGLLVGYDLPASMEAYRSRLRHFALEGDGGEVTGSAVSFFAEGADLSLAEGLVAALDRAAEVVDPRLRAAAEAAAAARAAAAAPADPAGQRGRKRPRKRRRSAAAPAATPPASAGGEVVTGDTAADDTGVGCDDAGGETADAKAADNA